MVERWAAAPPDPVLSTERFALIGQVTAPSASVNVGASPDSDGRCVRMTAEPPASSDRPVRAHRVTYVVTGAAGFIGSHLAAALLGRGDAVVGVDAFTDYYPRARKEANLARLLGHNGFTFLEADLSTVPLDFLVAGTSGVFHLAAQPGVRGSWGETFGIYLRDNLLATQRIFEAAARAGTRVVFASSSSVYGNAEGYPTSEDAVARPVSPYGVTKLCCEQLADAYRSVAGLDYVAMRYFTVYGPRQRPDMAVERIACALTHGGTFEVLGTGEQSRDVTYVDDAVTATLAAMDAAPAGAVYNVGGGSETSLREIIQLCASIAGQELDVRYKASAPGDVRRTAADTSRIRRDVGWTPQTSLEEGLTSQLASAVSPELLTLASAGPAG
jgi:nucleoside-diphosphate-sugar epimerase